jgi:hypothetical protein
MSRWIVVEDGFTHEIDPSTGEAWEPEEAQRQTRFAQQDDANVQAFEVDD